MEVGGRVVTLVEELVLRLIVGSGPVPEWLSLALATSSPHERVAPWLHIKITKRRCWNVMHISIYVPARLRSTAQ